MFVSQLIINPKNKNALRDLMNPYEMHRTLTRAFEGQNLEEARLLFRVESVDRTHGLPGVKVLVQNLNLVPDWSFLKAQPHYLLNVDGPKKFDFKPTAGSILTFRLNSNPTVKRNNKRYGIYKDDKIHEWITNKGVQNGFAVLNFSADTVWFGKTFKHTIDSNETIHYSKNDIPMLMVKFDGILQVTDSDLFAIAIANGIGSAKAFGMGLLSVAHA